jgi:hypothetical protein
MHVQKLIINNNNKNFPVYSHSTADKFIRWIWKITRMFQYFFFIIILFLSHVSYFFSSSSFMNCNVEWIVDEFISSNWTDYNHLLWYNFIDIFTISQGVDKNYSTSGRNWKEKAWEFKGWKLLFLKILLRFSQICSKFQQNSTESQSKLKGKDLDGNSRNKNSNLSKFDSESLKFALKSLKIEAKFCKISQINSDYSYWVPIP